MSLANSVFFPLSIENVCKEHLEVLNYISMHISIPNIILFIAHLRDLTAQ